jgi:hypothetical protein
LSCDGCVSTKIVGVGSKPVAVDFGASEICMAEAEAAGDWVAGAGAGDGWAISGFGCVAATLAGVADVPATDDTGAGVCIGAD